MVARKIQLSRLLFILLFTFFGFWQISNLHAQQDPLYSQYMLNQTVFNPAFTGTNQEFMCFTMLHRNQWIGFGAGNDFSGIAPQTTTLSFNAPVKKAISGLGFYVVEDKLGWQFRTSFILTASARHYFEFGTLHFGINGGLMQAGINARWNPNIIEPLPGPVSDMQPDLGAGLYLFSDRYYLGISSQHIIPVNFDWQPIENTLRTHTFVTGGLQLTLPSYPHIKFIPSALLKTDHTTVQLDLTGNVLYKDKYWGGLQYRNQTSMSMLLGMKFNDRMLIGYSYDLATNHIRKFSNGSHEFLINYCFNIKIVHPPPDTIWTPRFL